MNHSVHIKHTYKVQIIHYKALSADVPIHTCNNNTKHAKKQKIKATIEPT